MDQDLEERPHRVGPDNPPVLPLVEHPANPVELLVVLHDVHPFVDAVVDVEVLVNQHFVQFGG